MEILPDNWEDTAISIASVLFTLGAVPAVINPHAAIPRWQSLLVLVGILFLLVSYISLRLWKATVIETIAFVLWLFIFLFRPV